jgi:hypothetical protein
VFILGVVGVVGVGAPMLLAIALVLVLEVLYGVEPVVLLVVEMFENNQR